MRKFILILITFIFFSTGSAFSQNRSIRFMQKPWQEILDSAKKENKLIFLDAYASWCGPCKWMAANMFTNDTIADYYNKTFICASIDMEKGEGPTLSKKYRVRAYPSLIFIDTAGNMVHERVGAPQKIMDYLDMASVAQTPGEGLSAYMSKYSAGNDSPQFIETYLTRLAQAYISFDAVLKKYFDTQKESDLTNRVNWNIIYRYVIDMDDPRFTFLVNHKDDYGKLYSRDSVNEKIGSVYSYSLQKFTRIPQSAQNDSLYGLLKKRIQDSGYEGAGKIIFNSDLMLLQMREKRGAYVKLLYEGIDKYYPLDYTMLTNAAYTVLTLAADTLYLEKAAEWAKKSIALKSGPDNNDICASILLKLGRKEEAIRYEKDAVALAKKMNEPSGKYEQSLKKMQESDK